MLCRRGRGNRRPRLWVAGATLYGPSSSPCLCRDVAAMSISRGREGAVVRESGKGNDQFGRKNGGATERLIPRAGRFKFVRLLTTSEGKKMTIDARRRHLVLGSAAAVSQALIPGLDWAQFARLDTLPTGDNLTQRVLTDTINHTPHSDSTTQVT